MKKQWLNSTEVAEILEISPVTVRRWTNKGLLECKKTAGGHRRYSREAVQRHLDNAQACDTSLNSVAYSADSTSAQLSAVEFYNCVQMVNSVLELNLSIGSVVSAIELELEYAAERFSSIEGLESIVDELNDRQRVLVKSHITKLRGGMRYHDSAAQRIGIIQSTLDSISRVYKMSLSDLDEAEMQSRDESRIFDALKRELIALGRNTSGKFMNN